MKNIKYISWVTLLVFLGSCDSFLDINQDPSNPQTADGPTVLPPMLHQMVRGEAFDSRFIGQYIQNWGSSAAGNAWDRHGYIAGSDAGGEKWRSHYWSIGLNVDLIIEDATAKQQWDYVGVAKAIRAWSWQSTTDYHGEMILDQAWEPNRYIFDYDAQADVYAEVVRLSEEALADLAKTDGGVSVANLGRGDLVYAGDRTKWIKFVYANLARNAHHLTNKSAYNADKVIEYVDKAFSSNADNFRVPHAGTNADDSNFFGPLRNNMGGFRQASFAVSLMNGTVFTGVTDPRLPLIFTASPDGVFRGVGPALGDPNNTTGNIARIPTLWGNSPAVTATTGKYVFNNNTAHPLVTYSELQFIKAEAAFIKGDKATALIAYTNGIAANLDFVGVSATDKNTYLAGSAVQTVADNLTLKDIMLQKYIALIGHGCLETWVDMRRYHYDTNIYTGFTFPNPFDATNNELPVYRVRPRYNSEYVWNRAALDLIGGNNPDYHTYELWFSKAD
jgi:hypothetical protein